MVVLIYKQLPKKVYLLNRLAYCCDIHNINICRKNILMVSKHRTAAFHRSFSYNLCHIEHLSRLKINTTKSLFYQGVIEFNNPQKSRKRKKTKIIPTLEAYVIKQIIIDRVVHTVFVLIVK